MWADLTHGVTGRALDLDDVSPHVCKQHRAVWSRQHPGKVENSDPLEWTVRRISCAGLAHCPISF